MSHYRFAAEALGPSPRPALGSSAHQSSELFRGPDPENPDIEVLICGYLKLGGALLEPHKVAELWSTRGASMLERFSGHFSLVIVDWVQRQVLLATDRFSTRELVWARGANGGVVFGSSCTAVANLSGKRDISPQGIFDYVYCHVVPGADSIFREITKLGPASYAVLDSQRARVAEYWQPSFDQSASDLGTTCESLTAALRNAVRELDEPGRTGCFLSGGLDSSTIVGFHAQQPGADSQAFTIGFDAPGYDEMQYSEAVAEHFGVPLQPYYLTAQDIVENMPRVAAAYDEPFGNSSAIPVLVCADRASAAGKTVLLAGDGGDELFGGNERYAFQRLFRPYEQTPKWLRNLLIDPLSGILPTRTGPAPLRKVGRYFEQAKVPLPDRLEEYNFLRRSPPTSVFAPEFLSEIDVDYPLREKRERFNSVQAPTQLHRMLFLDWKYTLADNDLRKVGRMCALAGVDVRYPFLHDEVVDIACTLPSDWLVRGGELRALFRHAVAEFLPQKTLNKTKHGFGLPFGLWLDTHKPLHELVHDSIAGLRRRNLFQPKFIDQMLADHKHEHASYFGELIWILTMLELWYAQLQQGPRS